MFTSKQTMCRWMKSWLGNPQRLQFRSVIAVSKIHIRKFAEINPLIIIQLLQKLVNLLMNCVNLVQLLLCGATHAVGLTDKLDAAFSNQLQLQDWFYPAAI